MQIFWSPVGVRTDPWTRWEMAFFGWYSSAVPPLSLSLCWLSYGRESAAKVLRQDPDLSLIWQKLK